LKGASAQENCVITKVFQLRRSVSMVSNRVVIAADIETLKIKHTLQHYSTTGKSKI